MQPSIEASALCLRRSGEARGQPMDGSEKKLLLTFQWVDPGSGGWSWMPQDRVEVQLARARAARSTGTAVVAWALETRSDDSSSAVSSAPKRKSPPLGCHSATPP